MCLDQALSCKAPVPIEILIDGIAWGQEVVWKMPMAVSATRGAIVLLLTQTITLLSPHLHMRVINRHKAVVQETAWEFQQQFQQPPAKPAVLLK